MFSAGFARNRKLLGGPPEFQTESLSGNSLNTCRRRESGGQRGEPDDNSHRTGLETACRNQPCPTPARHLDRLAVAYVRKSTPFQVLENRESTARQYALKSRAGELGWSQARVKIIDSDLGRQAGENALGTREGSGSLCQLLSRDQVGGVFGVEISRLARNTVEWFQLLHLCRKHVVLLIEDGQIYAPSRDDDSLILGIRGTFSATELSILRARMAGGRRNKALRGALYYRAPIGFVRDGDGIRKDPDQRVQAAIRTVISRFREAGSARQVTALMREAGEEFLTRSDAAAPCR